jgi:hypothetical protein
MKKVACVFVMMSMGLLASGCLFGGGRTKPKNFVEGFEGNWKVIEVRDNMEQAKLWQTTVDVIALGFDMETLDPASGYLRTAWKVGYGFSHGDQVAEFYRVRVVIKFEPGFGRMRVKGEAEWRGSRGFDAGLTNDLYADLQGRIGRTVR